MSDDVLYTTRWVSKVRKPFPGHRWLSVDEARAAYESGSKIEVVDAVERDTEGNPRPRWVIGLGISGRVRVQFFTPGGSVWQLTDYDSIDGRLWRWITDTFVYPDQEAFYIQPQAVTKITAKFRPDGTGTVSFDERDGMVNTARMTGSPVEGFWLDRPRFGDWADLTNPDYGRPPETEAEPA